MDQITDDAKDTAREEALAERLDAFGASLKRKLDLAISGRKESGIEDEWLLAEIAYQGLDPALHGKTMPKPTSPDGGVSLSPSDKAASQTRSTVVPNITRPYVDAATARVADMLLPTDDSPWSIKPTPIASLPNEDELLKLSAQLAQPQGASAGMPPGMPPGMPGAPAGAMPPGAAPGMPPGMPAGAPPVPVDPMAQAVADALRLQEAAREKAKKAQDQIADWHIECQWHAEARKLIEDCGRLGTGVFKGPVPKRSRRKALRQTELGAELVIEDKIVPESLAVSPWNFYPDPACGECIHDGAYVWERDTITAKGLRELKESDGYIESQIDKCLEDGPQGKHNTPGFNVGRVSAKSDDIFDIWYGYVTAEREDLEAAGVDIPEDGDVSASVIVTMVNGRVIKCAINPLDSGEFPYDVMVWQRIAGTPWGRGVGMQMNVAQRILTAAVRNMMDNSGLTSGPQIVLRRGSITPADGKWVLTPRKMWFANDDSDVTDVRATFQVFDIPARQAELERVVQFALKMAEDVTGMPAMLQGQATHAPDTVGGMQMLQNNAGTVLRRIARLFDDRVTEPHIRRYYEYLMLYGEDDGAKGDFQIDARGSTALVERDLQNQAIAQMGSLVGNPAFGIDPEKWFTEMLKSQRLDPERFRMDEQKRAAMQNQPAPEAPQVAAAKIRAEADLQKVQMVVQKDVQIAQTDAQVTMERARLDTDRDAVYVQAQANRDQIAAEAKAEELRMRREELVLKRDLAMLDYANANKVTLDKIKADLAKKAMEIQATKELAGVKAPADRLPKPPVEPPGVAPVGESFTR